MEQVILFGTGRYGQMAYQIYGKDAIAYYIDNDSKKVGTEVNGINVRAVDDAVLDSNKYRIILCSIHYELMEQQLHQLGYTNYEIFSELKRFYPSTEFIYNPYEKSSERDLIEEDFIEKSNNSKMIDTINYRTDLLYTESKVFDHVEIETINRCNGVCDFCPVSKNHDTREFHKMSRKLFERIIDQLAEINYSGRIALFSNNEPFLDEDIISKNKYTREKLPNAYIHLWTNGTLLTVEKFVDIIQYLDELIIDNYQQELRLIKPCEQIVAYCEEHPELKKKVTIVLRKPHEIMTTRGGDAPNREKMVSYPHVKCPLPFKQLIVRPDGKVSLCCNDPLGKDTLGDLSKETVLEVWNGDKFKLVRECIHKGRGYWKHCEFCDLFITGGN
ncbi:MAG: radical SAM protein [Lachnospiraceae bacterium]|nr:radical SAM protein [Lachnospiraceae bacterium]